MKVYVPIIIEGREKYEYTHSLIGVYEKYSDAINCLVDELLKQDKICYESYIDSRAGKPELSEEDFIRVIKKKYTTEKKIIEILSKYGMNYKDGWYFKIEAREVI